MKKIFAVLLAGLFLFSSASAASMEFTVGSQAMLVDKGNGIEERTLEAAPFINAESRTMVPIRAIADAFDAEIGWNGETRTVTVEKGDVKIELVIDKDEATVNGEVRKLDTCPVIVADRTMVPLRFIGEALSCNVQYASLTKQILIDDTKAVLTCGDKKFGFAEFKMLYDIFYLGNLEYAVSSEMDETSYGQLVAQLALKTAENTLAMCTAFPSATLSQEEKAELSGKFEENAQVLPGMKGYLALAYEKNQIAAGEPILRFVQETEDVEGFYKENYVLAKHVLVEDEAMAKEVYEKAVGGEDFDELVKYYGMDPGMVENPNGYVFTKGEMVEEFEKATFAAKEGEITKPVKTDFGYHIIKRLPLPDLTVDMAEEVAVGIASEKLLTAEMPVMAMTVEELYEKLGVSSK